MRATTPRTDIEILRESLNLAVEMHCGNLLHPNVVRISQELDKQILEWTLSSVVSSRDT